MTKDNWIHYSDIDFNDTNIKQYHIDTRDFYCSINKNQTTNDLNLDKIKKYPDKFFYSVEEIVEILNRLYNESGGENEWRMLMLDGDGEEITSNWKLKYIRIYRTEFGLIICNSDNYAIKKSELNSKVNQLYLHAHSTIRNPIEIAKEYAIKCHTDVNHFYDINKPYSIHLNLTYEYGLKYDYLIEESDWINALSACYCHDLIEDCRQTYNNVKSKTNEVIANIVYAVTNEKGRNRKERANDKYYEGIKNTPLATFVKLSDRLANIKYSKDNDSERLECYKKEYAHFKEMLYIDSLKPMFNEIEELLK